MKAMAVPLKKDGTPDGRFKPRDIQPDWYSCVAIVGAEAVYSMGDRKPKRVMRVVEVN